MGAENGLVNGRRKREQVKGDVELLKNGGTSGISVFLETLLNY